MVSLIKDTFTDLPNTTPNSLKTLIDTNNFTNGLNNFNENDILQGLHYAYSVNNAYAIGYFLKHFIFSHNEINNLLKSSLYNNKVHIAKIIKKTKQITKNEIIDKYNLLFRFTCNFGCIDTAKFLVSAYDMTREEIMICDNYAFRWACYNNHMHVAKWLSNICNMSCNDIMANNNWIFKQACCKGDINLIKWLLKKSKYDVKIIDNVSTFYACKSHNIDIIKLLSKYNTLDKDNFLLRHDWVNLFDYLCGHGELDTIKTLCEIYDFSKDEIIGHDLSSLFCACYKSKKDTILWLIEKGNLQKNDIISNPKFTNHFNYYCDESIKKLIEDFYK